MSNAVKKGKKSFDRMRTIKMYNTVESAWYKFQIKLKGLFRADIRRSHIFPRSPFFVSFS